MRLDDKTLAEKLESMPVPEPPPELLDRLKSDIPEGTVLPAEPELESTPRASRRPAPWLRLAASLVLLVGGGMFAWWVVERAPELEETGSAEVGARATGQSTEEQLADAVHEPPPTESLPARNSPAPAPEAGASEASGARGSVSGRVVTPEGAPLPGALVTIQGDERDRQVVTDAEGRFRAEVPAGEYEVRTELEGFSTVETQGVRVRADEDVAFDVPAAPAVEDVVTVTSESPLLDARASLSGREQAAAAKPYRAVPVPDPTPDEAEPERSNERIEQHNQRIADMKIETKRLEEQMRDLEEAESARRAKVAPMSSPQAMPAPPPPSMPPSTGGSTEPNDQPYGDVFFQSYGANPFVDTEDDALSTFGFDVDTGSYGVVRRYLRDGHLPPEAAVRVEEIVNAFDYGDRPPRRGTFALTAEGAPSPWPPGERYYLVRLAVKGRELQRTEQKPVDLVFVIDTSGSMNYENRLGLVKRALALLLDRLGPDDRVALVTYGSRGEVRLPFTRDEETIRWAVDRLHPDGSTNAEEGLTLAYDLAARQGRANAVRRILLCSDGVANVGATGPDSILARIGEAARSGIELTTVGFGMGNYNDLLMEQLADKGNGRYAYVDTLDEARRLFVEELTGTLYSIAAEARAQVEFDPRIVSRYRLLGYENRDIADERFRDDTVDAAEIGSGHTVTALYEIKLRDGIEPRRGEGRRFGTFRVRYRPMDSERFEEATLPLDLGMLAPSWSSTSRAYRLSVVAARFAEILRGSYWARGGDLRELARRAEALVEDWRGDDRVEELVELIRRAERLHESD